jgi:hypothetical protein
MAVLNLSVSYYLFRKKVTDVNILYLLIGITLTFISLTAPLQLNGNFITLFWASEAVLLYWLYLKSNITIIRTSSVIVWAAMLISLVMDWSNVYNSTTSIPIILNRGFITTVYAATATYLLFVIMKREKLTVWNTNLPLLTKSVAVALLFIGGALEIVTQFQIYFPLVPYYLPYFSIYTFLFTVVAIEVDQRFSRQPVSATTLLVILVLCFVIYTATIPALYQVQQNSLTTSTLGALYNLTLLLSVVATALGLYKMVQLNRRVEWLQKYQDALSWLICAIIILYVSVVASLFTNTLLYSTSLGLLEIERVFIKAGLPILWGISSFIFMWLGMRYKYRPLRIISLTLFTITLAKLFIYDIRNIPVAGKIAAFFCLGVILLVVSFMYQRLKQIIIEDEKKVGP